jgi:hypothetical protein
MRTAEQVIHTALDALDSRKASVVDGRLNAFIARVGSRLPEAMILAAASRVMKRTFGPPRAMTHR